MNKSATKREISDRIAKKSGLSELECLKRVDFLLDIIVNCFSESARFEVRGFGSFNAKRYENHVGRVPGVDFIETKNKRRVKFRCSKHLLKEINKKH